MVGSAGLGAVRDRGRGRGAATAQQAASPWCLCWPAGVMSENTLLLLQILKKHMNKYYPISIVLS